MTDGDMHVRSRVQYHQRYLRIVDAYLEGTPASIKRAHRALDHFPRPAEDTVASFVWMPLYGELRDTGFTDNRDYLLELRNQLRGLSRTVERAYILYDYRPHMTPDERLWYARLVDLLGYVRSVIGAPQDVSPDALEEAYLSRVQEIADLQQRVRTFDTLDDEPAYLSVLRRAASILVNVGVGASAVRGGYPVAGGDYSVQAPNVYRYTPPDISSSLNLADAVLAAIAGQRWLMVSWERRGGSISFWCMSA